MKLEDLRARLNKVPPKCECKHIKKKARGENLQTMKGTHHAKGCPFRTKQSLCTCRGTRGPKGMSRRLFGDHHDLGCMMFEGRKKIRGKKTHVVSEDEKEEVALR